MGGQLRHTSEDDLPQVWRRCVEAMDLTTLNFVSDFSLHRRFEYLECKTYPWGLSHSTQVNIGDKRFKSTTVGLGVVGSYTGIYLY